MALGEVEQDISVADPARRWDRGTARSTLQGVLHLDAPGTRFWVLGPVHWRRPGAG